MESGTLDLAAGGGGQPFCPLVLDESSVMVPADSIGQPPEPVHPHHSGSRGLAQAAGSPLPGSTNAQGADEMDPRLVLRRTAELANAAFSLEDGVQSVQNYLAHSFGWASLGYRICARDEKLDSRAQIGVRARPALASARAAKVRRVRPVVVRVEDGSRLLAMMAFRPRQEASADQQALLAQVARQLMALARRDVHRQGIFAREFEILHQGQLAGMAEVAQGLSHELSQPLAALTAYAGALRRLLDSGRADSAEIAYLGERLLQQVDRAGGILQATKSFILRRTCATGSVDIEAIVRQLVAVARRELSAASIDLRLDVATGLPPVRGSESHLAQIVLSLLAYAVSALQPVSAEQRQVIVRLMHFEREVRIGITAGIRNTTSEIEDGQEPFYTAYADSARIGLAISRSLAEIQGGRLWKEEIDGQTSVVVALPVIH